MDGWMDGWICTVMGQVPKTYENNITRVRVCIIILRSVSDMNFGQLCINHFRVMWVALKRAVECLGGVIPV